MCGTNKDCGCTAEQQAQHQPSLYRDRTEDVAELESVRASLSPLEGLVAAAGEPDPETGLPTQWHAVLTVEGLRTTDHRRIAENILTWRQLPLALFAQFENAGHGGADLVGKITAIEREVWLTSMFLIKGEGTFDLKSEQGRKAAQMCDDGILRWGSVDLEIIGSRYVEVQTGGGDEGDLMDILFGEDEGPSGDKDWYDEVTEARIMGFTMHPTAAFPQAVMAPLGTELDIPEPQGSAPQVAEGLRASAVKIPTEPPKAFFEHPGLDGPTPLEIRDDGRIFGHLALWNTCHTGFSDTCVVPPKSKTDYAYFNLAPVKCQSGELIRAGKITFDTGHAGPTVGWEDTTKHYDHTGTAAADVVAGEDEFGVWVSGALRPGLTTEQLRTIRSAPLSGDWRRISGGLELVAALSVNVPGFPIVASAGVRNQEQVSLITAGVKPRDPIAEMAREIATLRRAVRPLMEVSTRQLSLRINRSGGTANPRNGFGNFTQRPSLQALKERVNAGR